MGTTGYCKIFYENDNLYVKHLLVESPKSSNCACQNPHDIMEMTCSTIWCFGLYFDVMGEC